MCESAHEATVTPEPDTEPAKPTRAYAFDDEITDLSTAARAIVAAGYKSLNRKHKDSDVITILLAQAKDHLKGLIAQ
jgi:hypothetical protein